MVFIDNKYTLWYYSIISRARIRNISGYTEKHHIIPHSLGGSNLAENLVKLTAREHFICHKLLTKMLVDAKSRSKMMYAYRALAILTPPGRPPIKINSSEFEKLRSLGLRKGLKTSEETKLKISIIKKGQNIGEKNPMYGKTHTIETRQQISKLRKEKAADPTWNIRPACSEEKANKIRKANLGRKWVHKLASCERKKFLPVIS